MLLETSHHLVFTLHILIHLPPNRLPFLCQTSPAQPSSPSQPVSKLTRTTMLEKSPSSWPESENVSWKDFKKSIFEGKSQSATKSWLTIHRWEEKLLASLVYRLGSLLWTGMLWNSLCDVLTFWKMKWGGQRLDWPSTQRGSPEISWKDQYSRRGQRKMMKKTNVDVRAALC